MQLLENHEIFYKKKALPDLCVGDTATVTIYLELPKEQADGEKKRKRAYASLRRSNNFKTP
jgi:hypothetical protein